MNATDHLLHSVARLSVLQPTELAAMGQLAQLIELSLYGTACADAANWSFLSQLQQLQYLAVEPRLPYVAVTALAHLPCLSELIYGWEQQQAPGCVAAHCAAVCDLFVVSGAPPLCALRGVTKLTQYMPWDPSVLSSVSEWCTGLQQLVFPVISGYRVVFNEGSLLGSVPAAARTAAVCSLTVLKQLNELHIAVNDNAEVTVVSALKHVQKLIVEVPLSSRCTVQGLAVALGAMRQLQRVAIMLPGGSKDSLVEADVQLLLSALLHLQRVCLWVYEQHVEGVQDVVQHAVGVLEEQGLQLAAKPVVEAI
jgi:hypothetical protein